MLAIAEAPENKAKNPDMAPGMARDMDAAFWNSIANDPSVRPNLGGEGVLDVTALVENPANYALRFNGGGFLCVAHGGGVYSVHTLFIDGARAGVSSAVRCGLDFMFTRTDCNLLWSHFPDGNEGAANLGKAAGFDFWFRGNHPLLGPSRFGRIPVDSWIMGPNADYLVWEGEDFHELLEAAKKAAGSGLPHHPDDDCHNRYVGAACLMAKRGHAAKGVYVYNQWAAAAGYAPLSLVSASPPVVDVGDAIIGLGADGELEVLKCR